MKESRNRETTIQREPSTEYIFSERCEFCKKSCRWLKTRSSEILERIEGNFFKIFCLKVNWPKFLPPIFVIQISAPQFIRSSAMAEQWLWFLICFKPLNVRSPETADAGKLMKPHWNFDIRNTADRPCPNIYHPNVFKGLNIRPIVRKQGAQ